MKNLPPALKTVLNQKKKHKYNAKRTTCLYGHNHDSQKEAMWCIKLHELSKERKISCLTVEPVYLLIVNGEFICKHLPDFQYLKLISPGVFVEEVVDVKGMQTPEWKLKYKLFKALYPNINYLVV